MLKKLILMISYTMSIGVISLHAQHGADWPFYIAFEDAEEARDTIWFVFDDDGTYQPDPELGEIPIDVDDGEFHVWLYLPSEFEEIPYNVSAVELSPFSAVDGYIHADNFTLPITLSWDSAMFQSPLLLDALGFGVNFARLDNDWIFFNGGSEDQFDMLATNTLVLPVYQYSHFPLFYNIQVGEPITIGTKEEYPLEILAFPNPVNARLNIQAEQPISEIQIYDLSGKMVIEEKNRKELLTVDVAGLTKGMYTAVVTDIRGNRGVKKFVKM